MKIIYFIILGLIIICLIFSIVQIPFFFVSFYTGTALEVYLFIKIVIGIAMLTIIQKGYNGDWTENKCDNLKKLALFWLIYHYISIISLILYIIAAFFRALLGSDRYI